MKLVDDVLKHAGLYDVILKLIDAYDGDTHMDWTFRTGFHVFVLAPFVRMIEEFRVFASQDTSRPLGPILPRYVLYLVVASPLSVTKQSIMFSCSRHSAKIHHQIMDFVLREYRHNNTCRLWTYNGSLLYDADQKILIADYENRHHCPEAQHPETRYLIFNAPPTATRTNFKMFHIR